MSLFTVGPVEMYPETLEIRSHQIPYFRTPEFSEMMNKMDEKLKKMVGTSQKSKTIYLTASGTAGMEAVVMNSFNTHDKLLIVNGGTFGQRFVDICQ
ncbi:MAG: alanine--glyoxylate aminotransferase family protein, partial [Eubacterium sp.]